MEFEVKVPYIKLPHVQMVYILAFSDHSVSSLKIYN